MIMHKSNPITDNKFLIGYIIIFVSLLLTASGVSAAVTISEYSTSKTGDPVLVSEMDTGSASSLAEYGFRPEDTYPCRHVQLDPTFMKTKMPGYRVTSVDIGIYPEGDMPNDLVFTPDHSTLLVCYTYSDTVTFLDVGTATMTGWVDTGEYPTSIDVTSDGVLAVTTNHFTHDLTVIDVATQTVARTIALNNFPDVCEQPGVVETIPGTHLAVVGCDISDTLHLVNLDSGEERGVLTGIPCFVRSFSFSSDTGKSYVLFNEIQAMPDASRILIPDDGGDQIIFIDPVSFTVASTLTVPERPYGLDISPDGTTAVIAHAMDSRITVIDPRIPSVIDSYTMAFYVSPNMILITTDNQYIFVSGPSNETTVLRTADGTIAGSIYTGSVGGFACTPASDYGFVGNFNSRIFDTTGFSVVKTLTIGSVTKTDYVRSYPIAGALNSTFSEEVYVYDINGTAGSVLATLWGGILPEGDGPRGIAVTRDGTRAITGNILSDSISVVDLDKKTVLGIVQVGNRPGNVGVTVNGDYALSANYDEDFISIVDLNSLTKVADVTVKERPVRFAFTSDGLLALVPSIKNGSVDYVSVIQLAGPASTNIADIPVGDLRTIPVTYWTASGLDVNADNRMAVVCNSTNNTVSILDLTTLTVAATVPVGTLPAEVDCSPVNAMRALVTNFDSDTVMYLRVTGASSAVLATIPVGDSPYQVIYTPDSAHAFVSNYNGDSISVLNMSTVTEVKKIPLTDHPRGMDMDAAGEWLIVACVDGSFNRIQIDGDSSILFDSTTVPQPVCDLKVSSRFELGVVSHVNTDTISVVQYDDAPVPIVNSITIGLVFFLLSTLLLTTVLKNLI